MGRLLEGSRRVLEASRPVWGPYWASWNALSASGGLPGPFWALLGGGLALPEAARDAFGAGPEAVRRPGAPMRRQGC